MPSDSFQTVSCRASLWCTSNSKYQKYTSLRQGKIPPPPEATGLLQDRSAANTWRCALTQENKNAYSSEIEVHLFVFRRARKQLFIPRHAINLTFRASHCTGLKQKQKKHNIIRTTHDTARNNDDIIVTSTKSHFHRCAARLWFCTTSLLHPGPAAGLAEFNNPFVLSNIFFVITAWVLLLFFNLSLLCKRSL